MWIDRSRAWWACVLGVAASAGCRTSDPSASPTPPEVAVKTAAPADKAPKTDGRLEIDLSIDDGEFVDRVPMRTARLSFHNVSPDPLRVYLPNGEPFRANISTLFFASTVHPDVFFVEPEPRPHGYVVTEADFHSLAPGETRVFTQRFTLDPFARGPGLRAERRPGFPVGSDAVVRWTYENALRRFPGGVATLDGPTKTLFDGGDVPGLWRGRLTVVTRWRVP